MIRLLVGLFCQGKKACKLYLLPCLPEPIFNRSLELCSGIACKKTSAAACGCAHVKKVHEEAKKHLAKFCLAPALPKESWKLALLVRNVGESQSGFPKVLFPPPLNFIGKKPIVGDKKRRNRSMLTYQVYDPGGGQPHGYEDGNELGQPV